MNEILEALGLEGHPVQSLTLDFPGLDEVAKVSLVILPDAEQFGQVAAVIKRHQIHIGEAIDEGKRMREDRPTRIPVIAGNYALYRNFLRANGLKDRIDAYYISRPGMLSGLHMCNVWLVEGWDRRKDWPEMRERLEMGWCRTTAVDPFAEAPGMVEGSPESPHPRGGSISLPSNPSQPRL